MGYSSVTHSANCGGLSAIVADELLLGSSDRVAGEPGHLISECIIYAASRDEHGHLQKLPNLSFVALLKA